MLSDLRFAIRTLARTPVFAVAAVLTLSLGIGATTSIFSVVDAVLLRSLPYPQPNQLVIVNETNNRLHIQNFSSSVLNYLSWKEVAQSFESIGAVGGASFNLSGRGDPENFTGATVTPSLFHLLGIQPVRGRAFREGEDAPSAQPVAMIGEALWKRRFGGEESLIGSRLTLSGVDYTVIGIAPASLALLTNGEVWVPLTIDRSKEIRLNHTITTVARVKPGVSVRQAQAEMETVVSRLKKQYPELQDWGINLVTFFRTFVSEQLKTALLVLLAAVMFVLLIACANVANLMLSRAAARQSEIAVRTAMGAGRGRLIRQLLTESMLLALCGGGAGILAALWTIRLMNRGLPPSVIPIPTIPIDGGVLAFACALTLLTGLIFGLVPAWDASRSDLAALLKQGGRGGVGTARKLTHRVLVGGELALATVLLISAGLLIQTLLRLEHVTLGFNPAGVLTFQITPPASKYQGVAKQWPLYRSMIEALETIPGVRGAAISSAVPMGNGTYATTPSTAPPPSLMAPGDAIPIDWRTVSPNYFRTMEIPILRGRLFNEQDTSTNPPVAMISQRAARRFWGDADPIGRVVRLTSSGKEWQVIGVVGDVRNTALATDPAPAIYFPATIRLWPAMDVAVRTAGKPESILPAVQQKIRELDPELPIATVRTMDSWVANSASASRLNAILLAAFAGVALLIAAIGVYGVLSYSVNRRVREIGLRMALGAQQGNVLRLVVTEGMLVALIGIGVGLAGAFGVGHALSTLLFGIRPNDPPTFALVASVLAIIALIACVLPARRAARIDPVIALREE
jgi:putative ABC transport system permease protein